jgi:hypothetical protein
MTTVRIMTRTALLSLLATSLLAQAPAPAFRTWTSTDGRKVEASLLTTDGTSVSIKLRDGKVFSLPLDRLSAEDQAFAKAQISTAAPGAVSSSTASAEKTWPRGVALDEPPEPKTITEDAAKKEFVYRSEHYEFRCDSKLGGNVVREFSRIFESTWLLNCKLPLDLKPKPEPLREFFVCQLYTNKEDYLREGGIEGSAGIYMSAKKSIQVPLSSLGVKMVGSRVSLEKSGDDDNATLIHEITHQMMNHWLGKIRTWYAEGSAECVEMLEYQRGRFSLVGLKNRLQNYLQRMGSDGKNFTMLDPQELFTIDFRAWAAALGGTGRQATQNYASACLATYYFYYLDGAGDAANMIAYLRAIEDSRDDAVEEAAFQKHLIRGRSMDQLKDDMKKAFRKEGVSLSFEAMGKNGAVSNAQ